METQERNGALVIVVDDYADTRQMIASFLEMAGWRVIQAATAPQALEMAARLHPDAILMDLCLPGMDGWEAVRRLRHTAATHAVPVVACTARTDAAALDGAFEAGCEAVVTKPCDLEQLLDTLRGAIAAERDRRH